MTKQYLYYCLDDLVLSECTVKRYCLGTTKVIDGKEYTHCFEISQESTYKYLKKQLSPATYPPCMPTIPLPGGG